eukprot:15057114-Ditylum_brightwellii.AAC.1
MGGLRFCPLCIKTTEKEYFSPVSQTYYTSRASLTSNTNHPMLMSHSASTQALDEQSKANN